MSAVALIAAAEAADFGSSPELLDALDALRVAITLFDSAERLIYCNRHFNHVFRSMPPREVLYGRSYAEMIRLEVEGGEILPLYADIESFVARRRAQLHGGALQPRDMTLADGRILEIKARRTKTGGWIALWTDVTQARHGALAEQTRAHAHIQRALAQSQLQAKRQKTYLADLTRQLDFPAAETETAKTAFLRTMSHELKTPLNAIIGFADLLQMSPGQFSQQQVGDYAGLIHVAGKNLLRLLNQILDLTKISAGRFPLQFTNVAAGGALWMAMDGARAKAEAKSISIVIGVCEPDLLVRADEHAFGTIVAQLIDNAVSFTQDNGTVRVSAQRAAGCVRIVIADDGPGVPADNLLRILEPFERGARGTSEQAQGPGLGLPLAKALAELQRGSLSIASTLGQGFTATLELPAA